jgi:hypothetical protein
MKTPIESGSLGTLTAGRFDSQPCTPVLPGNSSLVATTIPKQLSAERLSPPNLDQVDTDMDGVAWLRGGAHSTRKSPEPATGPGDDVDTDVYNSGCGGSPGPN